jgi:hypothetical protein
MGDNGPTCAWAKMGDISFAHGGKKGDWPKNSPVSTVVHVIFVAITVVPVWPWDARVHEALRPSSGVLPYYSSL